MENGAEQPEEDGLSPWRWQSMQRAVELEAERSANSSSRDKRIELQWPNRWNEAENAGKKESSREHLEDKRGDKTSQPHSPTIYKKNIKKRSKNEKKQTK